MELDELKNTWQALDKKLDENKSLNDRIIKEMLYEKGNKSLSSLFRQEIFGLVGVLMILVFIAHLYSTRGSELGKIPLIVFFCLDLLYIVWQSIKVFVLMKVDLVGKFIENIKKVNQYKLLIKYEKLSNIFIYPIVIVSCSYLYLKLNAPAMAWILLVCLFVVVILLSYWGYKRIYDKNISSIRNSLDELKDLEEE